MAASLDINDFLFKSEKNHIGKEIIIGNNTWVCAGAIILPGVTIKGDCVVAAGAVVSKDIEARYVIVAGNPARVIKRMQ